MVRRYGRRGEERREEKEGERRACAPFTLHLNFTTHLRTFFLSSSLPYAARHIILTVLTCHSSFSCSHVSYRSIFMSHSSCDTVGVCVCVHVEGREGWGKNESAAMAACVYACVHVCVCVCVCSRREGRGRGGARMRRAGREREGRGKNASHLTQLQERGHVGL